MKTKRRQSRPVWPYWSTAMVSIQGKGRGEKVRFMENQYEGSDFDEVKAQWDKAWLWFRQNATARFPSHLSWDHLYARLSLTSLAVSNSSVKLNTRGMTTKRCRANGNKHASGMSSLLMPHLHHCWNCQTTSCILTMLMQHRGNGFVGRRRVWHRHRYGIPNRVYKGVRQGQMHGMNQCRCSNEVSRLWRLAPCAVAKSCKRISFCLPGCCWKVQQVDGLHLSVWVVWEWSFLTWMPRALLWNRVSVFECFLH